MKIIIELECEVPSEVGHDILDGSDLCRNAAFAGTLVHGMTHDDLVRRRKSTTAVPIILPNGRRVGLWRVR